MPDYKDVVLAPCPFCSGEAKLTEVRRGNYTRCGDNYQGLCNSCRARGPLCQDDFMEAARRWDALAAAVADWKAGKISVFRFATFAEYDDVVARLGAVVASQPRRSSLLLTPPREESRK